MRSRFVVLGRILKICDNLPCDHHSRIKSNQMLVMLHEFNKHWGKTPKIPNRAAHDCCGPTPADFHKKSHKPRKKTKQTTQYLIDSLKITKAIPNNNPIFVCVFFSAIPSKTFLNGFHHPIHTGIHDWLSIRKTHKD